MSEAKGGYLANKAREEYNDYKRFLISDQSLDDKEKKILHSLKFELDEGNMDHVIDLKLNVYLHNIPPKVTMGTIILKYFDGPIDSVITTVLYDKNVPVFINLSPTYISMDGEYRNLLIPFERYQTFVKENEVYLTKILHKLYENHKIKLYSHNCDVVSAEIAVTILYIIYFNRSYYFQNIDINWELLYSKKIPFIKVDHQRELITDLAMIQGLGPHVVYRSGTKLLPLSIDSIKNMYSLLDDVWHELYVNMICNKLVLAGVTSALPCTYNKSMVTIDKYKYLFSLKKNHIKYKNSKISVAIEKDLIRAEQRCLENDVYINYDYQVLGESIQESIRFSERTVHLSNEALLIFMGHKGLSLNNAINRAKSDSCDPIPWKNLIFIIFYTLYCLNQNKIIHNDLHLGNIVINGFSDDDKHIYQLYCVDLDGDIIDMQDSREAEESVLTNEKVFKKKDVNVFHVSEADFHDPRPHDIKYTKGRQKIFMLPLGPLLPTIIDFSRAILLLNFKDELNQLKINAKIRASIMSAYHSFFPDFMRNNSDRIKEELKDLKLFFNKYAAMDGYRFCSLLLSKEIANKDNEDIHERLVKIKGQLEDILLYPGPWMGNNPNFLILNTFDFPLIKKGKILDVYVSNAPQVYSLNKYDKFPPLAKLFKNIDNEDHETSSAGVIEDLILKRRREGVKFTSNYDDY